MKKYTYVLLSLFLFNGCAPLDTSIINLDLDKIHSSKSKYGVILFRPIYFKNADYDYICHNNLNVFETNQDMIIATYPNHHYISRSHNEMRALMFEYDGSSVWSAPNSLKAEYFYGVRMMPEGRYYFKMVLSTVGHRDYKETEEVNYFDVKAGEVTYIGDYYWMNNVKFDRNFKDRLMTQTRGSVEMKLCDRFDEAKQFFQKYYSHVKLREC